MFERAYEECKKLSVGGLRCHSLPQELGICVLERSVGAQACVVIVYARILYGLRNVQMTLFGLMFMVRVHLIW